MSILESPCADSNPMIYGTRAVAYTFWYREGWNDPVWTFKRIASVWLIGIVEHILGAFCLVSCVPLLMAQIDSQYGLHVSVCWVSFKTLSWPSPEQVELESLEVRSGHYSFLKVIPVCSQFWDHLQFSRSQSWKRRKIEVYNFHSCSHLLVEKDASLSSNSLVQANYAFLNVLVATLNEWVRRNRWDNFNNKFYLAWYILNLSISTYDQYKNIYEIFYILFFFLVSSILNQVHTVDLQCISVWTSYF